MGWNRRLLQAGKQGIARIRRRPEQQDSRDNLVKSGQSTPSTERKRKQTAQKSEAQKLDTTEKPKTEGHKMRFLVGTDNGKMNATITISKEEIDRQFQYPGKKQSDQGI